MAISRRTLLSRSALLVALGGGAALGVTKGVHHKVAVPPPPPPAALIAVANVQATAQITLDKAVAAGLRAPVPLTALRTQMQAHGDAVRGLLENYPGFRLKPGAIAAIVSTDPTMADLGAAITTAAASFSAACLAWPATEEHAAQVVPVLGSIAASLSAQAQVLT